MEVFERGSLTNTTLLVNAEATEIAAALAIANPKLGVGLHFNLTLGRPVLPPEQISSLVDSEGRFFSRYSFSRRALLGQIRPEEVGAELNAQMNRFRAMGLKPTHIDSHQHIHALPNVFPVVFAVALEQKLPLLNPAETPIRLGRAGLGSIKQTVSKRALRYFCRANGQRFGFPGLVPANGSFFSIFGLVPLPSHIHFEHYRLILKAIPPGFAELMVHVAKVDDQYRSLIKIGGLSQQEYETLLTQNLSKIARDEGIRTITYRELV
jgi:hypothetical protein